MNVESVNSPRVKLLQRYKWLQEEYEFEQENFYRQTQRTEILKCVRQEVCWDIQ